MQHLVLHFSNAGHSDLPDTSAVDSIMEAINVPDLDQFRLILTGLRTGVPSYAYYNEAAGQWIKMTAPADRVTLTILAATPA